MVEAAFAEIGNRLTRALLTDDFALYQSVMALPLRIVPRGDPAYVLEDESALRQDFDLYHRSIRTAGITDIYREVDHVIPEDSGFRVFCRVHIMARAHRLAEPHRSEMLLLPSEAGLRIAEIISAPEHIDWTLGRRSIDPAGGMI